MMLGNITVCGEADDEAQINETFPDQINSERESSINQSFAQDLIQETSPCGSVSWRMCLTQVLRQKIGRG